MGEKGVDEENRKILRAISIFKDIGYKDDLKKQSDFIVTNKLITSLVLDEDIAKDKFHELLNHFIKREIFETSGRFLKIRPITLAHYLAGEWWDNCRIDKIPAILNSIKDDEDLLNSFFERLRKLDKNKKVIEFAELLCSNKIVIEQGKTVNSLDFINTKIGSQIICYLTEIIPEKIVYLLEKTFTDFKVYDYVKIKDGRRNILRALQLLCFRERTFNRATKILFNLALAENEPINNNSTGQFINLFKIFLSGTEANLENRLEILKDIVKKNISKEITLIIKALKAGLMTNPNYFMRMSGAEIQGSSLPLKDYEPTNKEVTEYQKGILDLLTKITSQNIENLDYASLVIAESIREIASFGNIEIIETILKNLIEKKNNFWTEALDELKKTQKFEKNLSANDNKIIEELIYLLSPKTIENKIKLTITNPIPNWDIEKDNDGNYKNTLKDKAEELALELVNNNSWFQYLKIIYEGEQKQSVSFGKKLGELSDSDFAKEFVNESIKALKHIGDGQRSYDSLAGFLESFFDKSFVKDILEQIINDEILFEGAFYIFSKASPDFETIFKLFELKDRKNLPIKNFHYLRFDKNFYDLKAEDILTLCKRISEYGMEGMWVSIILIYNSLENNKNYFVTYQDFIKKIIFEENFLLESLKIDHTIVFSDFWKNLVFKFLKPDTDKKIISLIITRNIINFLKENYKYGKFTHEIKEIINYLFENNFEDVWPDFGKAILDLDYTIYLALSDIIGANNSISQKNDGILFKIKNYDFLFSWCKQNFPNSVRIIAGIMPVYKLREIKGISDKHPKRNEIDDEEPLHPFAKKFIDEFGDDELVLSEFSSKLASNGLSGNGAFSNLYKLQKKVYEALLEHKFIRVSEWSRQKLPYINDSIKGIKDFEGEMFR